MQQKTKEKEAHVASLTETLATTNTYAGKLEADLKMRINSEKRFQETAIDVSALAEVHAKDLRSARKQNAELQEKVALLETQREKTSKDLEELEREKNAAGLVYFLLCNKIT